jgi:Ca-activated chloride channel family protein
VRNEYTEFDGQRGGFLSPDDLFPQQGISDFLLEYGEPGLEALDAHPDEQIQQLIEEMIQAGLLERDEDGTLRLTPRMQRGLQHRAFLEIFRSLDAGVRDGHETPEPGSGGERSEGTRPYEFGDPISELDLGRSMRNAMQRLASERGEAGGGALPIRFVDRDFELYNVESTADTAIAILIDLSGSMMRYGRHIAAKRVAMGMAALVREKFPLDTIDYIGFASVAERIDEKDLPMVMPKPITTREWEVRVRCPLDQAELTHPHFTNLHHGLRLARETLRRRGAANKQVFLITDGQPTAHLTAGGEGPLLGTGEGAGAILNLIYPPAQESAEATLAEARRCYQEGIRISSFALIEEYYGMEWVGFVDQLTRLVKGVSFYCTAGDLGSTIMESYLSGKREKKPLG